MGQLISDIRLALRQLRNAPGFTLTAVLTLALGIGANASIFTLVNAVLLRDLPVKEPKMLYRIGDNDDCCVNGGIPDEDKYSIFAYDLYQYVRDHTPEFEQLAAMQASGGDRVTVRREGQGEQPHSVRSEFISGNYFSMLGVEPGAGRMLSTSDDREGAPIAAVLSYGAWQRIFASDPSIVGATVAVNTHPVTVVGITPPAFYGERMNDAPPDIYLPFSSEPVMTSTSILHRHEANWVYMMGRVKPGVQIGPLQAKVSGELRQWLPQLGVYKRAGAEADLQKTHTIIVPAAIGVGNMQQNFGSGLHLLMAISALVLLIACANIANLVLVRGLARRTQTSIRMALGAQRSTLIRQMLTESITLSIIGGVAGLVVAYLGTRALIALAFPDAVGLPIQASPSPLVLLFAFVLSLLTGIVFGVAPAWITSHSDPAEALRGANRSTRDSAPILQRTLVILQAALSLVLLVAASMLTRSLNKLQHQDFGVIRENRVVVHLSPYDAGFKPAALQALYDNLQDRFRAIPGVARVGLATYSPLEGNNWGEGVQIEGKGEPGLHDQIGSSWTRVSPDFLQLVGHKLVRGRWIGPQDTATSPAVAVVNQAFVKKFFPNGQDPIGHHFGLGGLKSAHEIEIVGVVTDAKYNNEKEPQRAMYFRPLLQQAPESDGPSVRSLYVGAMMLQLDRPIEGLESQVRRTFAAIDPNLTVVEYSTFEKQIDGRFNQERLLSRLTGMFGLLALALASVGLYGVTAYLVVRRTAEIGIRMALGASRPLVVRSVMMEAMLQSIVGLVIGVPVVFLCSRYLKTLLYGITGVDGLSILFAVGALLLAAWVASLVPALRAASTDPVKALRTE
ncbi:ABC transporter permease [Terriglobus roseus]|uniref:Duplicated orphan permease n=1 Tax=Terriglobus roseus TaxID=392734 RepID=A0A1H4IWM1_9BACT|nr:ABC transporter permease [Terriglobus roseus]SEB37688.1 duplicated orphan permease [Terriglobus roseus]